MSRKIASSIPIKMWIDGKIFPIRRDLKREQNVPKPENDEISLYNEEYLRLLDINENNGRFMTTIKVPRLYYLKLRHFSEFDIKGISEQTDTEISIPKMGQEGLIALSSSTTEILIKSVTYVLSAIGFIREQSKPMQFMCIPCCSPNIQERFNHLKKEILDMQDDIKGLHESIFMKPEKLHITIDVYALLDKQEKAAAIQTLSKYKRTLEEMLADSGPPKLMIESLDCMNTNMKKVDVIYANVKMVNENVSLQKIVNHLAEHFYHKGLAFKYQKDVKLHMTIINTKYRSSIASPKRKCKRESVDATKIIDKFKNYTFGECDFNAIHLSEMSVKGEDGFYKPVAVLSLGNETTN